MLNKSLQVAGTFMATTLAIAVTAPNAQAIVDFTFSGFTAGSLSASGTFRISDAAVASETLTQADILDWEINVDTNSGGANDYTLYGNGEGFGTDNSDIANFSGGSVNSSQLTLNREFCIHPSGNCNRSRLFELTTFSDRLGNNLGGFEESLNTATFVASSVPSTPVPFGVIADTGLGILAGIWGISRLRKTMRGRKSFSK